MQLDSGNSTEPHNPTVGTGVRNTNRKRTQGVNGETSHAKYGTIHYDSPRKRHRRSIRKLGRSERGFQSGRERGAAQGPAGLLAGLVRLCGTPGDSLVARPGRNSGTGCCAPRATRIADARPISISIRASRCPPRPRD